MDREKEMGVVKRRPKMEKLQSNIYSFYRYRNFFLKTA